MYKDKERQKEANKLANQRYRKKGITVGITKYHPIMDILIDPVKRKKLERVCDELKNHKVIEQVYYGCGANPIRMDVVSEMLDVTGVVK